MNTIALPSIIGPDRDVASTFLGAPPSLASPVSDDRSNVFLTSGDARVIAGNVLSTFTGPIEKVDIHVTDHVGGRVGLSGLVNPVSDIHEHVCNILQSNYDDVTLSLTEDAFENTCTWLLKHQLYETWLKSEGTQSLWLCGPPGSGKTIVSRFVLQNWKSASIESHNAAYFFFSGQVEKASTPVNCLSGLIHQILQQYPTTKQILKELPALKSLTSAATHISSERGLWSLLIQILAALKSALLTDSQKPLLCMIDGLEECVDSPNRYFLQRLTEDLCTSGFAVKVFVTCRQDYLERCRHIVVPKTTIHVDQQNSADIQKYVSSHLRWWSQNSADSEVVKKLELAIINLADGIFLWAALVVDCLLQRGSRLKTVVDTINSFPKGRDEKLKRLYEEILRKASNDLDQDMISDIRSILRIVILSARPLTLKELSAFLKAENHDESHLDLLYDIESTCRGLLKVEGEVVKPVHITLVTYIVDPKDCLSQFHIDPNDGHAQLAEICLNYAVDPISLTMFDGPEDIATTLEDYHFLDYATTQWPYHVGRSTSRRQTIGCLIQDLLGPDRQYRIWYSMILLSQNMLRHQLHLFRLSTGQFFELSSLEPSPAHIISLIGLETDLFAALFTSDQFDTFSEEALGPNNKDSQGRTPMHWAAACSIIYGTLTDPLSAMTVFITHSVKVDALFHKSGPLAYMAEIYPENVHVQDLTGRTPLHLACASGSRPNVQILLDAKASIDVQDLTGHSPLHYCCGPMGFEVAKLLIANNARPDLCAENDNHPLHIAAFHGQEKIVKLLIERKAPVNAQNLFGMTPMHFAVIFGEKYAQLLVAGMIKHGLFEKLGGYAETHVSSFVESLTAQETTVKRLVAGGADLELKTIFGETALFSAAFAGHLHLVKLLVAARADVNAVNAYGWTAVYGAAFMGHELVVQFLTKSNANLLIGDYRSNTPLHTAAQLGHCNTVKYLIESGIDVNTPNEDGYTPLHNAAMTNMEIMKSLAKSAQQAVPNAVPYLAALKERPVAVRLKDHEEVVNCLLNAGAKVDAVGVDGKTPLHVAAAHGHSRILNVLLEKGADLNTSHHQGGRAIDIAAFMGNDSCVKTLIEYQAEFQAVENDATLSPIHLASTMGNDSTVSILLSAGAQVDGNTDGSLTPVHMIMEADGSEYIIAPSATLDENNLPHLDVTAATVYMAQRNRTWQEIEEGQHKCLIRLLSNGANVNARARGGLTALHLAAKHGRESMIEVLIKNKADIEARSDDGLTALWYALFGSAPSVVRKLISCGADVEALHVNGLPPLLAAIAFEQDETSIALIEGGANTNIAVDVSPACLSLAAEMGRVDIVKALLSNGANAKTKNKDGDTALYCAALSGHVDVVNLLLQEHININAQGYLGTSLQAAVQDGHIEVVKALLAKGADVMLQRSDELSALHLAVENNHLEITELLLDKGADILSPDLGGRTPLHRAAKNGNAMMIRYLLENGAEINGIDTDGNTPLHLADEQSSIEVVRLLLEKGADAMARKNDGWTPLQIAASRGHIMLAEALIEHKVDIDSATEGGFTPLHLAAYHNHLEIVRVLIKKGAQLSTKNSAGWTPLLSAIANGHTMIVMELLDRNADQSVNINGNTPLHLAAEHNESDIMLALLKYSPNTNSTNDRGMCPLHIAVKGGNQTAVELLLRAGATANARGPGGYTPMHYAAFRGITDVLQLLLAHKGDLNARDNNGRIPLHIAAGNGHANACKWLLDRGAYIDAVDKQGWTPLLAALHVRQHDVVMRLTDADADVCIGTKDGTLPQHLAAARDEVESLKLLEARGASLDVTTTHDSTLLHVAASSKGCAVLKFLLQERQVDPNVTACLRISPLHTAVYANHLPAVKLLVAAGADIQQIDGYGRNCLDWASSYPAMRTALLDGATDPEPSTAEVSHQIVLQSIGELLSWEDSDDETMFHLLGHCFLRISEDEYARMSFAQEIIGGSKMEDLTHNATCNMCTTDALIRGKRFVCHECADIDLCEECMNAYARDWCMIACRGHRFMEIPGPKWAVASAGQDGVPNFVDKSRQEWLEQIRSEFLTKSLALR